MSLGRAGQALGLALVLALSSEALCRGGPPDASRRLGLEPPHHVHQGQICAWGVAWRIAVSTMTPSAGKQNISKDVTLLSSAFFFFESSKKKEPFPLSALSAIICYLLSLVSLSPGLFLSRISLEVCFPHTLTQIPTACSVYWEVVLLE